MTPDPAVVARLQEVRQLLLVVRQAVFQAYLNVNAANAATTAWAGDDRAAFARDMEQVGLYIRRSDTYLANQINAYDALIWDYERGSG